MKESIVTSFTCEICGQSWATKEFCEKCEALGYPKNYDKLLGKWIIVPASIYFSSKKSEHSYVFLPETLWRVVRIDSNYITNLVPGMTSTSEPIGYGEFEKRYEGELLKLNHRLVVNCKGFEDNSKIDSLKIHFDVPEEMFESLNNKLVAMELERQGDKEATIQKYGLSNFMVKFFTSEEFEKKQHLLAEQTLKEVIEKTKIELPVIEAEELPSITLQQVSQKANEL